MLNWQDSDSKIRIDGCFADRIEVGQLIFACVVLFCLWPFLKPGMLSKTPVLDSLLRRGGSFLAFAFGLYLLTRGVWGMGLPLLVLAAGMRGWLPQLPDGVIPGSTTRPSSVRTADLVIMLDASRQPVDGQVIRGRFSGRRLSAMQAGELMQLRAEIAADFVGRSILEAYLDRRLAGWREHFKDDAHARGFGAAASDAMTKQEAYQILGVQPGASAQEIRRAHRALMKKIHPDKGGTTQMAARVNRARDMLLEGH
ncbi:DnaJ domain-containing protein [Labrys neptuniae]|uniref:DnaJ domain-containing protein n=1 Tax=Labrys neptuniae TaxID=376174 RepID=A0ABV3PEL4_9HYPH